MDQAQRASARGAIVVGAVLLLFATVYLAQFLTLAPNPTDEALVLGYIHDIAHGKRPFWDFVDAYGPLNWVFPVFFYRAWGEKVLAVRLWLLVVKLATLVLSYRLVRRMSDGLHALLAASFMAVLLGQGWQSLETAYAFLTVMPLLVGAWYLLLFRPLGRPERNIDVAAVLTAFTLLTKVNTGVYLLAGGLFWLFYWARELDEPASYRLEGSEPAPSRALEGLGLAVYGVAFTLLVHRYFDATYFVYLVAPLLLGLAATARVLLGRKERAARPSFRWHAAHAGRYAAVTFAVSAALLVGYFGPRGALRYVAEISALLSKLQYVAPFPPLGQPGHYKNLNEYYWLQLPCLSTLLYATWLYFGQERDLGTKVFGDGWRERRARTSGLFQFATLEAFTLYSRSDETHIFQVLVVTPPVLFVLLYQLEAFARTARLAYGLALRIGGALVATGYASTLFVLPRMSRFRVASDFACPHLEYIHFRPLDGPSVRPDSPSITDPEWDRALDESGRYLASVTSADEEVLLLTPERLPFYLSETRPVGGRYYYYFYLVSVGLLDRAGYDALVPPSVLEGILAHPPRVMVSAYLHAPLADAFPELRELRDLHYTKTRAFRHILVYERIAP